MSIAASLQRHLSRKRVAYDVVTHPPTMASVLTAQACRVPPERLAKGVVVRTGDRYVLAVLPASRRISRADLKAELGENFAFASENELENCSRIVLLEPSLRSASAMGSTLSSSLASAISRTSISKAATTPRSYT